MRGYVDKRNNLFGAYAANPACVILIIVPEDEAEDSRYQHFLLALGVDFLWLPHP